MFYDENNPVISKNIPKTIINNKNDLKKWIVTVKQMIKCGFCNIEFSKKQTLSNHIKRLHTSEDEKVYYKCEFEDCEYKTVVLGYLTKHVKVHISIKECKCELCGKELRNERCLQDHKINKHEIGVIWTHCDVKDCTYKCKQTARIKDHMKYSHSENGLETFKCPQKECEFETNYEGNIKQHLSSMHDIDVKWHKCEIKDCEYECKDLSALASHKKNKHEIGVKYKYCDQKDCTYKSKTGGHLKSHKAAKHGIGAVYIECQQDDCSYKTTDKGNFKKHLADIHNIDVKWHKCNQGDCTEQFKQNSNLKSHKENVHDMGNNKCGFCVGNRYSSVTYDDEQGKHKICRACYNKVTGKNSRSEKQMSDYLDEKFGIEYLLKTDKTIKGNACTNYRPDKLYASPGLVVHIECDEHQHTRSNSKYECDEKRISDIYDEFPGNKHIVIRWNPDKYEIEGKMMNRRDRLTFLSEVIKKVQVNFQKLPHIFIVYMFYDENNPVISKNIPKTIINNKNDLKKWDINN
jgi:hypothetical protein